VYNFQSVTVQFLLRLKRKQKYGLILSEIASLQIFLCAIRDNTRYISYERGLKKNPRGIVAAMKINDLRTRNFEEPFRASFHYDGDSRSIDRPGGRSAASFFTWSTGDSGTINSCSFLFPVFMYTAVIDA